MAHTMLPCSEETLSALHELVPGLSEVPDEQKLETILQHIQAEALPSASAAADRDAQNLSVADPQISTALFEALKSQRDLCVSRGALTPAVADALLARLAPENQILDFSRSDESGAGLALSIFTALAENQPIVAGQRSGLQSLPRIVPGETRPDGPPLYKKMAAMADGESVEL